MRTLSHTNVITLARVPRAGRDDAPLNAEWDRLVHLVEEAWTWRDPETLAAVDDCVARLGLHLQKEWKE